MPDIVARLLVALSMMILMVNGLNAIDHRRYKLALFTVLIMLFIMYANRGLYPHWIWG